METIEEFQAALDTLSARNGGTVILSSEMEKGYLTLKDVGSDLGEIVITSEDPDNPSSIVGMRMFDSHNVTITGVTFDSVDHERAYALRDFMTLNCKDISIVDNKFVGSAESILLSGSERAGDGIMIRNTTGVEFSDNHVSGYTHAMSLIDSAGADISGNEFTRLQGDAIHGGGWRDVTIENNWFHSMLGSTQEVSHSDFIQLWGTNVRTVTDGVTIRGNFLDSGEGPAYQSIFIRHDRDAPASRFHRDILIEDNIIHNAMVNAIRVSGTRDVEVVDNTVLWNAASVVNKTADLTIIRVPIIYVSALSGTVEGNIAPKIKALGGVTASDNIFVSYSSAADPDFVGNHFAGALTGGEASLLDLELLPTSPWVGQFGAAGSQPSLTSPTLMPVMIQESVEADRGLLVLDASLTRDAQGYVGEERGMFVWTFEDGSTAYGVRVVQDFGDASGSVEVRLSVTTRNETSMVDRAISVQGREVAAIDFDQAAALADFKDVPELVAGFEGKGVHIGGNHRAGLNNDTAFHHLENFSISLVLEKDTANASGRIVDLNKAMHMTIDKAGQLSFSLTTDAGTFVVDSGAVVVKDTKAHQFDIVYDGTGQSLSLYVDGGLAGVTEGHGTTVEPYYHGFMFGTHRFRDSMEGVVDNFSMRAEVRDAREIAMRYEEAFSKPAARATVEAFEPAFAIEKMAADNFLFENMLSIAQVDVVSLEPDHGLSEILGASDTWISESVEPGHLQDEIMLASTSETDMVYLGWVA